MTTPQYLNPHQARTADPTPYEKKLAAVIEDVFGSGAHDLPGLGARRKPPAQPAPAGHPGDAGPLR
ncbi:recombinase-like helix-turn-helix domain-containing protein, partial [Streptomyces sp. NPDC059744]|uniref:recombinase-like helix-turn-helix domain-containing protein n=1 Tax=Streptomyces sp. NPDC059744 TaxID=3346929 RepID=UPI003651257F